MVLLTFQKAQVCAAAVVLGGVHITLTAPYSMTSSLHSKAQVCAAAVVLGGGYVRHLALLEAKRNVANNAPAPFKPAPQARAKLMAKSMRPKQRALLEAQMAATAGEKKINFIDPECAREH